MNITKPHPNVAIKTMISVNLSASQWKLSTEDFPRSVIESVANYINKRIMMTYNKGGNKGLVQIAFKSITDDFRIYGATSRETKKVFEKLLKEIYVKSAYKDE